MGTILLALAIAVGITLPVVLFLRTRMGLNALEDSWSGQNYYISLMETQLRELRTIRHEYNNLIQSVVCSIENQDWSELCRFKEEMIRKVASFNTLSMTALLKLRDYRLLWAVSGFIASRLNRSVPVNLYIADEIDRKDTGGIDLRKLLLLYLSDAVEIAEGCSNGRINLKISKSEEHTTFLIECTYLPESPDPAAGVRAAPGFHSRELTTERRRTLRLLHRNKRIRYGMYVEDGMFKQELTIRRVCG